MTWTKLDDSILGDPKLAAAGDPAKLLFINALVWSNRHLTNGMIPKLALREILPDWDGRDWRQDWERLPLKLIEVGVWVAESDGYKIIRFDRYQRSKDDVVKDREAAAKRQRAYKDRKKHEAAGNAVTTPARTPTSRSGSARSRRESRRE